MMYVVVVAGRRIDEPGATPERFPARNRDLVCARITDRLRALRASVVVASAACGTDLLALQAARALGLGLRIVLPFDVTRFRETSVVDRPGDFGPVFDDVCASAGGDLVVLDSSDEGDAAYAAVNRALLDEAAALAGTGGTVVALVACEGARRSTTDLTADLANGAHTRGWMVHVVSTL